MLKWCSPTITSAALINTVVWQKSRSKQRTPNVCKDTQKQILYAYIIRSNISGLLCSLIFMRSFIAIMMLLVRSSMPCFELFSAAPAKHSQTPTVLYTVCQRRHPKVMTNWPRTAFLSINSSNYSYIHNWQNDCRCCR